MFKKIIIKLRTRKNLKERKPFPSGDFRASRKVAILCSDLLSERDMLDTVVSGLKAEGKETSVLVYCHNPKKIQTQLPHFVAKDVSLSGEMKSDTLSFFTRQHYDFALCLDRSNHFLIDYVFSTIGANCRVGLMLPSRDAFFELMVHAEGEEKVVSQELLKYLKMIHSNDN